MGRASLSALAEDEGIRVVAGLGRRGASYIGKTVAELAVPAGGSLANLKISDDISEVLTDSSADILLEFSEAASAFSYAKAALNKKIRPVVGTSGLTTAQLHELSELAQQEKTGALVVPNFSVGAVLMMNFAQQAARLFDNVEIVETHKLGKKDAPSGTAVHTVREIEASGKQFNQSSTEERELIAGARGAKSQNGVRVHSVRLPGILSLQEVMFGADGELLTIRHDSFSTKCFAKGIILAIHSVMNLNSLVVGLESFVLRTGNA